MKLIRLVLHLYGLELLTKKREAVLYKNLHQI